MTLRIDINSDIPCKRCGEPGAAKTREMNDYGLCLKCIGRGIDMIIGDNTMAMVISEIAAYLNLNIGQIDMAYQEGDYELNVSLSVKFRTDKHGKHKAYVNGKFAKGFIKMGREIDVNEAQQQLPGMD